MRPRPAPWSRLRASRGPASRSLATARASARGRRAHGALTATVLGASVASGCTFVGTGEGEVTSSALVARDCWHGAFDLRPDFFAAIPYRDTLQIRVQHGSDIQEVSDGVSVLVNEISGIRPRPCTFGSDCASGVCTEGMCEAEDRRGQALEVGLPPQLLDEIAPGIPFGAPPPVSMALYLQYSCHSQNVVLYAVEGSITFNDLFSGDPNESAGSEKLTDAFFDVMIADPRDAVPGTLDIPDDAKSPLTGWFRFHFQRGQPGQPFP